MMKSQQIYRWIWFLMLSLAVPSLFTVAHAQQTEYPSFKGWTGLAAHANVYAGQNEGGLSAAVVKHWGLGARERFRIGVGVRLSSYLSNNQVFETAPARLTSNQEGPQVIFVETQRGNIDTVKVDDLATTTSLNLMLNLAYGFAPKWEVGFNIDLAGLSVGNRPSGQFISSYYPASQYQTAVTARATPVNLLLISDNDWGSLNSEFYVRYAATSRWAIQAGASFLFAELTTDQKYLFDNDRFRRKAFMGMVGVTYFINR